MTGSLPVQPQAIMGSGWVDPSSDAGWTVLRDVEERQDWMGTGSSQKNSSEDPVSFVPSSNTMKCEDFKRRE